MMNDSNLLAGNDSTMATAQPASRLRHLAATILDGLVWMGLAFVAYVAESWLFFEDHENTLVAVVVAIFLVMPLYFLTEVFGFRSLGKRIAGVAIATKDGASPTRRRRLLRWVIKSSPWIAGIGLKILSVFLPQTRLVHGLLVQFPNTVEALVIGSLMRLMAMCHLDLMNWEVVLYPPLFAIRFLGPGMLLMTPLMIGYLLTIFPSRRTLLDRLSGTTVIRRQKQSRGFEALPKARHPQDLSPRRPALGH